MRLAGFVFVAALLGACGGGGSGGNPGTHPPPDTGYLMEPAGTRIWLTRSQLFEADALPGSPLNEGWLVAVGTPLPATHRFSGTLHLTGLALHSNGPATFDGRNLRFFPAVDLRFLSDGDQLIPLDRAILGAPNGTTYWRLVLGPGRVWDEPGDGSYSRAAFPFALVHKERGEVHNGIATFVYDASTVSRLRLQVVQETAAWARDDYWAQLPMSYAPATFTDAADVIADHDQELADAYPVRTWAELEQAAGTALNGFEAGVAADRRQCEWNRPGRRDLPRHLHHALRRLSILRRHAPRRLLGHEVRGCGARPRAARPEIRSRACWRNASQTGWRSPPHTMGGAT